MGDSAYSCCVLASSDVADSRATAKAEWHQHSLRKKPCSFAPTVDRRGLLIATRPSAPFQSGDTLPPEDTLPPPTLRQHLSASPPTHLTTPQAPGSHELALCFHGTAWHHALSPRCHVSDTRPFNDNAEKINKQKCLCKAFSIKRRQLRL